jgi:hypothetical protein
VKPAVAIAVVVCVAGCGDRRQPIRIKGDAGPSVVVVDPVKRSTQPVPLVDETEPNDDLAHAQPMEPEKGIRGTIGDPRPPVKKNGKPTSDEDWFSWLAPGAPGPDGGTAFDEVRVELSGVPGIDLILDVLDGDGKKLATANDGAVGEGEVIPNLGVDPGRTYYFRVRAAAPMKGEKPYELVVRAGPAPLGDEREPNDDAAHATLLPALSDASGFFGRKRDEDWLALPVAGASGTLRIEVTPVEGVSPEAKIVAGDAKSPPLALARAGKGDELRLRNAPLPANAPAWLVLRAVEGRNPDIRWGLHLSAEPFLDGAEREPNDSIATANALPFAGAAQIAGFLWPGDADVFHVTGVPADGLVTVELEGVERVDLRLERLGPDGKSLVKADDGGPGKGEQLPPWPGGDFYLRVSARGRDAAFDAPYRLSVGSSPAEPDLEREPNDSPERATPFAVAPGAMRGYLAPKGDVDYFRFVAPAGHSKASVEATGPFAVSAKVTDESKLPLGPSAPVTPGKTYYVQVKAQSEKSANAKEPYTVILRIE